MEAKLIDGPKGKTETLYCSNGIKRFLDGEYGWGGREAFLLAYVRDGSTFAAKLAPHFALPVNASAYALEAAPDGLGLACDGARTRHGRGFIYTHVSAPANTPDEALWERVQSQLEMRATMQPQSQRRPKHLLSGLGRCGVCGAGWIKIRTGYWGCAGARNGGGCSNTRIISDERYELRVLSGLKERLLDPEAVALFVREYHEENARRDREEGRVRARLERRMAETTARIDRLVEALASGAQGFSEIRGKLVEARAQREALKEEVASIEGERVIALHPAIASDYRSAVEALNRSLAENNTPEARDDAIPRIRALIDWITLTPAAIGRGVDIEIGGRLARMIELATGRPLAEGVMITLERVKGIEPSS